MTNQRKEEIKLLLKDYLEKILGIDTRKNFRCLSPEHEDRNPSMSFNSKNNTVHCFSCKATYDIFDLVGINYNVAGQEKFDLTEAICIEKLDLKPMGVKEVQKVSDFLKDKTVDQRPAEKKEKTKMTIKEKYSKDSCDIQDVIEVNEYINKCKEHLKETDYFTNRGITKEIQEKFYLGFDPNFKTGADIWKGAVIRTSWTSYIVRNTDQAAEKRDRMRKSNGKSFLFNFKHITQMTDDFIFICEGEFDVLSFEVVGVPSVGLGGVNNIDELVELLKEYRPQKPIIIALDNDTTGRKTTQSLIEKLEKEKIYYYNADWLYNDCKDANELLIADKEKFKKNIEKAKIKARAEGQTYKQKNNLDYIESFIDDIYSYNNDEFIKTGFKKLDEVLGGGIRVGLYTVGAIPSLGKTTMILQVCDHMAAAGQNILFFSLEMARKELISKSVSRLTLAESIKRFIKNKTTKEITLGSPEINKAATLAKTTTGITTGSKYKYYSNEEIEVIMTAFKQYENIAKNFYIVENDGVMTAEKILEEVSKHIEQTGKVPVVIVDFLQIVAPKKEGITDKQNADNTVLALKKITRDYKTPVIAISSFNRDAYTKGASMESFKESGGVEYCSDVIIGLQFEGTGEIEDGKKKPKNIDFNAEKAKIIRDVEAVILKNRNGMTGKKINFRYMASFNHFEEK